MGITYEDIKKANDAMPTSMIKDKPYMEVNNRIKAFRMLYPQGTISTEIISNEGGVCIIKAMVYADSDPSTLLGTGHAYEKEGSTFINKTSYIENCETSAVGRALGMAGIGIDTSIASYEEVQNAVANQGKKQEVDPKWLAAIEAECERTGISKASMLKQMGLKSEKDIDFAAFNKIMKTFEKTADKGNE